MGINMFNGSSTKVEDAASSVLEQTQGQGIDAGAIDINQGLEEAPADAQDFPESIEE